MGKGRFHEQQLARQRALLGQAGDTRQATSDSHSGSGEGSYLDNEAREKIHQQLDAELLDKRRAIDRGYYMS